MFRKGFYKGWLTNKSLLQLRKEIVLGSIYLWDYENSFNISRVQVCDFFNGFIEYIEELMSEDGKDNSHFKEYDTDENLLAWYGCFDENPFTKFIEETN